MMNKDPYTGQEHPEPVLTDLFLQDAKIQAQQADQAGSQAARKDPTLNDLAEELYTLEVQIDDLEAQLETLKQRRTEIRETALIDLMRQHKVLVGNKGKFTFSGGTCYVEGRVYCNYKDDRKQEVFSWLQTIGRSELVKTIVHPQSLSALVRELRDEGHPISPAVQVVEKLTARIRKR